MCSIRDPMVFQKVNDGNVNQVEEFARSDLDDILTSMKLAGRSINEIDFYGEIYAHKPSLFKFSIGDRILILRLLDQSNQIKICQRKRVASHKTIDRSLANESPSAKIQHDSQQWKSKFS